MPEAAAPYHAALTIREKTFGTDHPEMAVTLTRKKGDIPIFRRVFCLKTGN